MNSSDSSGLERQIARRFEELADNGWFTRDIASDWFQLTALRAAIEFAPGQRILDAGCARGRFLRALQDSPAELYGVDITPVFVADARVNAPRATIVEGSLTALPFKEAFFDAAFAIEVFEHLPGCTDALIELRRILKPGGRLVVMDKSLLGLDPKTGIPNCLLKPWREWRGEWMYPRDFGFRERWFWPWAMASTLRRFFGRCETRYLISGRYGRAVRLYRWLPFFAMDVAWIADRLP